MFKSKLFYLILIILILSGIFIFQKYAHVENKNQIAYLMETTTSQNLAGNSAQKNESPTQIKRYGSLVILSGEPNSQNMANALLCVENSNDIDKVDLFMPDMGHGSEPPKVTSALVPKEFSKQLNTIPNFGCYSVESMQLFMPGTWQVRAFYKDGVVGIFTLMLKK
jgi:hypothetical protein